MLRAVILAALAKSHKSGLLAAGIVDYDGGRGVRERIADRAVVVRSNYNTPRIQEEQAPIYRVLRGLIDEAAGERG